MKLEILENTSGQHGGIGRYTLPPNTTKVRTTPSLKTRNNQNFQHVKLYRSLTARKLKKHSSRLVGGAETGSRGGEDAQQGSGWRTCVGELEAGGLGHPTLACG